MLCADTNVDIRYDSVYLTSSKTLTVSQLSLPLGMSKQLK